MEDLTEQNQENAQTVHGEQKSEQENPSQNAPLSPVQGNVKKPKEGAKGLRLAVTTIAAIALFVVELGFFIFAIAAYAPNLTMDELALAVAFTFMFTLMPTVIAGVITAVLSALSIKKNKKIAISLLVLSLIIVIACIVFFVVVLYGTQN